MPTTLPGLQHRKSPEKEEEEFKQQLWESNTLGLHSPQALLNAVFYLNGKNFCLRGGEEHRALKISQVERCSDPPSYRYVENGSKNRNSTFAQRYVTNKIVPIHANPALKEQCHVRVLDLYYAKLLRDGMGKDVFYLRLLPKMPAKQDLPWFSSVPVGRNELHKMVQKMCADAGISGKKTNHNLRATGASQLFQANVPEKVIQERTGHRSLEALRLYKKTTTEQHQAVAQVLGSSATLSYESIVQKQQEITVSPRPPQMAPTLNMSGCTVNIFFNSLMKVAVGCRNV